MGERRQHQVAHLPPLLRWAGSKRQLADQLTAQISDQDKRYVEPFAGSACLFFALAPTAALLADLNSELIVTYCAIVDSPEKVADALDAIGPGSKETYYAIRANQSAAMPPWTRAARFIYLNRYCFNGLYRANARGQFNVPYGGGKTGKLPTRGELINYAKALKAAELLAADFEETVDHVVEGDFVYLDPPYAVEGEWRRGRFYTNEGFHVSDVERLQEAAVEIDRRGATFLISYVDGVESAALAEAWHSATISVRRTIAGSAFKRVPRSERLISNRPLNLAPATKDHRGVA